MGIKRNDILLTKFDIEILKYLSDDENKPFNKMKLYSHFEHKGNNRIDDRIKNLISNNIIEEKDIRIKNRKCKGLKILNKSNSLIRIFGDSTR